MNETLQVSILFLAGVLFVIICCVIVMFKFLKNDKKFLIIDEEYKKYIYGYQPTEVENKSERPKPPKDGNIAQSK